MEVPRTVPPTISAKEFAERRYIAKAVNAGVNYMRSKLSGFPFDAQVARYGDITRIVITVQWIPQPVAPEIVPSAYVEGRQ